MSQRIEVSPNGVEHLVINGRCATCGRQHDDTFERCEMPDGWCSIHDV